jgi:hypothetical protein
MNISQEIVHQGESKMFQVEKVDIRYFLAARSSFFINTKPDFPSRSSFFGGDRG